QSEGAERMMWRIILGLLAAFCGVPPVVAEPPAGSPTTESSAEAPSPAALAFFETKIRPVLIEHCYDCHSDESGAAEGELRVDTREAIRAGGERGPAVVPGDV